jgi:L-demethylnoviosyl transferase
MRVMVTVNDAYGHVLPLVPTVHALARQGHAVLLGCPGPTGGVARAPGVEVRQFDPMPVPELSPEQMPPRSQRQERLEWSVRTSWPNAARGWAAALLDDARAWRPDVIVTEPVEHAGRVVAAALDVPLVEHGWGFTLPAGLDDDAAAGITDVYTALGATPRPPALRVDLGHHGIQAADGPPGVERYRYVPWSPPADPLPRGTAPNYGLAGGVLVTLGTFPHPDASTRLQTAVRAIAGLDRDVVVALGNRDRANGAEWPPGVTAAAWLDLPAEVRRCALVVHHGGAGTSWATLAAGVPAVCLPQAGDQFRNANLLACANAGVVVLPEDATELAVRDAAEHALRDTDLAASATRARLANQALPGPGELAERLTRVTD